MTDVFWIEQGTNTGTGTEVDPYTSFTFAKTSSVLTDTLVALAGIQNLATGQYEIDVDRKWSGQAGAVLRVTDTAQTAVMTTTVAIGNLDTPVEFSNLKFDTQYDGVSAAPNTAFTLTEQGAGDIITTSWTDCEFVSGDNYALFIDDRAGTQNLNNVTFSGHVGIAMLQSTSNLSAKSDQVVNINGATFAPFPISTTGRLLIDLDKGTTSTNTLTLNLNDVTADIHVEDGLIFNFATLNNEDQISIDGWDITLNGQGASSMSGLLVRGVDVSNPLANVSITNSTFRGFGPAGFALEYGASQVDSFITNGDITNCAFIGQTEELATPHGPVMGQGTTGTLDGCFSTLWYVGYLFSIVDDVTTQNTPLAYDCNGPSFYAKGCQGGTVSGCTAALSGKVVQRDTGVLAATFQGVTNNVGFTFSGNNIFVSDVSKINALASIGNAVQGVTFSANVYTIADTVDVENDLLFVFDNGVDGPANQTLAQWNANTEVTGDIIEQIPQAELDEIIANLDPLRAAHGPTQISRYSTLTFSLGATGTIDLGANWSGSDSFSITELPPWMSQQGSTGVVDFTSASWGGKNSANTVGGGVWHINVEAIAVNGLSTSAGIWVYISL